MPTGESQQTSFYTRGWQCNFKSQLVTPQFVEISVIKSD